MQIQKINFVLPTREKELYFWAKHKNFFKKKGVNVLVTNYKNIEICNDKLQFNKILENNNFPYLKTLEFKGNLKKILY